MLQHGKMMCYDHLQQQKTSHPKFPPNGGRMLRKLLLICIVSVLLLSADRSRGDVTRAALDRVLPEIKFTNVALKDCFDFLRDISGANLHINWKAIESVGITEDTQVNVRLRGVTLRKVLNVLMSKSGATGQLTFYSDEGVIEVTTRELADKQLITKVYNVEDLMLEIPDFESSTNFNLLAQQNGANGGAGGSGGGIQNTLQPGGGGGAGAGLNGSGSGASTDKQTSKADRGKNLVDLIMETIQPDVWRPNGGPAAIRFWNGSLIVTAPRSVHEQIGGPVD